MIFILYTADYEIFFGENYYSERDVLIEPTNGLLETCENIGIPITLFCDVACLWRYKELGLNKFPEEAELQLKSAIKRGHDVQAHIHPHWLKATKNSNVWDWDLKNYLLGNTSDEECYNSSIFFLKKAAEYLSELLKPIESSYQCIAFRAGGWGLQPKEKQIIKALENCNYTIDSSIIKDFELTNDLAEINFSNVPDDFNYFISSNTGLNVAAQSGIFEIPIPGQYIYNVKSQLIQFLNMLSYKTFKLEIITNNRLVRGVTLPPRKLKIQGINNFSLKILRIIKKFVSIVQPTFSSLELTGRSANELFKMTNNYLKDRNIDRNIYFSFSTHPKFITQEDFETLAQYHTMLLDEYGSDICAITFQNADKKIQ